MPSAKRSLFDLARAELRRLGIAEAELCGRRLGGESIRTFIPRMTPGHESPEHLAPVLDLLERVRKAMRGEGPPVRAVVSAPPRHAKTDTFLAAFAWLLAGDPKYTHCYATYGDKLARSKSRKARTLTLQTGVPFMDGKPGPLHEWRTAAGGGLLATSVLGPLTGQGINGLLVIDDSLKNRIEAESKLHRDRQWDWFTDVAKTRLEPGASVIVTMARWHTDDLAGRCLALGYEHINLPALAEAGDPLGRPVGAPLWPRHRPLEYLLELQETLGPYSWASLFQGAPRPREGKVFRGTAFFDSAPSGGYRVAVGLDLAYTEQTKADWSVLVVMLFKDGLYYVTNVLRAQLEAPAFAAECAKVLARYPRTVRPVWYASGTEKGVAQFFQKLGINVLAKPPKGDKFVRAQPLAAAWNAGKVQVPRDSDAYPWVDGYVERLLDFTGSGRGEVDDEVDATAPAFDTLQAAGENRSSAGARAAMRLPTLPRATEQA